jgi:hypothetical protein
MSNYFRITAYHPEHDISVIMDCNGMFEKLWQFSSYMVQKGFKIIEVGNEDKFIDGDIVKIDEYDKDHIYCRASGDGKPTVIGDTIEVNGIKYQVIH